MRAQLLASTAVIAVVSISGGKDSLSTAIRAVETHGIEHVRLVHANTGHEHEITERYVREDIPRMFGIPVDIIQADFTKAIERKRRYIAEHWRDDGISQEQIDRALEFLIPTGIPFLDLCLMKGRFPSRKASFCTQELKRIPLDHYMIDLMQQGLHVESCLSG